MVPPTAQRILCPVVHRARCSVLQCTADLPQGLHSPLCETISGRHDALVLFKGRQYSTWILISTSPENPRPAAALLTRLITADLSVRCTLPSAIKLSKRFRLLRNEKGNSISVSISSFTVKSKLVERLIVLHRI